MWEAIEFRELRVFLALAEELHFGRTAERLHLTPSRISQSLNGLERKLGGQLVYRTSRRVELTALGERFRDEAGAVLEQLVAVFERTQAASRPLEGTLRLSLFSGPSGGPHLLSIVEAFEARHPECRAELAEVSFLDLFGSLRRGEIDLMATWLPHGQPDLVTGPTLTRLPRVLAVARGHPLAERERVSIEEVADYEVPHVMPEHLVPSKTPGGRTLRRRRFGELAHGDRGQLNTELALLVARGVLVHPTVPSVKDYWGHPDIVYIPITDMPPLKAGLVWLRRATDPRLRAFIQVAREVLRAT